MRRRYDDETGAWYENTGEGDDPAARFAQRVVSTLATDATSTFACDVDGDGDVDALGTNSNYDLVYWSENDGDQSFAVRFVDFGGADGASDVVAFDVDGDADVDVVSSSRDDDKVAWHENDGSQSFATQTISTTVGFAISVWAGDVNGDGAADVLAAAYGLAARTS